MAKFPDLSDVIEYYLHYDEWQRLEKSTYHKLEFLTHSHFLQKYLKPESKIADIGAGPGRYAFNLAQKGHQLTVIDLCEHFVTLGRQKSKQFELLINWQVADVRDLSNLDDNVFDATICFGPLSHLLELGDQIKAREELIRITKPRGLIFTSVCNRYAKYRSILKSKSDDLIDPHHKLLFSEGIHRRVWHPEENVMEAFYYTPNDFLNLFTHSKLEILERISTQGLASHLQEEVNILAKDNLKWEQWLELHFKTCTDPTIWGIATHMMLISRVLP